VERLAQRAVRAVVRHAPAPLTARHFAGRASHPQDNVTQHSQVAADSPMMDLVAIGVAAAW
jgi:hypothetical protein